MKRILIVVVALTLGACAAKTSPERHSLYYARHNPVMAGGNYVSKPTDTAKLNLPVYQKMYKQGQDAKVKGLSPVQAQAVADEIYKVNAKPASSTVTYMSLKDHQTQATPDERQSQLWGQTLKDTFLDGYNGVN